MPEIGFIYKLCCRDPTVKEVYIGSTKNLRVRKNPHKTNCNNVNIKQYNYNVYQYAQEFPPLISKLLVLVFLQRTLIYIK